MSPNLILTTKQMCQADALTIACGTTSIELMESARHSVVNEIKKRWEPFKMIVLCGPGNNDVEGFMMARLLLEACWPLRLVLGAIKTYYWEIAPKQLINGQVPSIIHS